MLRHKFIFPLFVALLLLTLLLAALDLIGFYWLLPLILLYSLIAFFGAYLIGLNFHITSLNHLDRNKQEVVLSFDDGPYAATTEQVLAVLKRHEVRAVFFMIGKQIPGQEPLLKRMKEEGHLIGNHSYSHHFWFDLWSTQRIREDLQQCSQLIHAATGEATRLFRPPYGVTTPNIRRALKGLNLRSIGWDLRSYDTSIGDSQKILDRILQKVKPGSIILLHDRLPFMPELLEQLLICLKERNYQCVLPSVHPYEP